MTTTRVNPGTPTRATITVERGASGPRYTLTIERDDAPAVALDYGANLSAAIFRFKDEARAMRRRTSLTPSKA